MKKKTISKRPIVKKTKETKKKTTPAKNTLLVREFITKEMFIAEVVAKYPEAIEVFYKYELHCIGCFASEFDTVESGAKVHGINVEHLLHDVNKHISKNKKK